ncbi:hypothetical protein [Streptomyces sp. URMC 123]|uniref:hypothetical protein n=1 Tax=Streptomyces sp. URMC 123 TaxID=3423403 RepID=UPI003F1AB3E5
MTAAAAGSLLCALWFVPSANATVDAPAEKPGGSGAGKPANAPAATGDRGGAAHAGSAPEGRGAERLALADTGSVDTTPYLMGGTAFLGCGAALVVVATRRSRAAGPDL